MTGEVVIYKRETTMSKIKKSAARPSDLTNVEHLGHLSPRDAGAKAVGRAYGTDPATQPDQPEEDPRVAAAEAAGGTFSDYLQAGRVRKADDADPLGRLGASLSEFRKAIARDSTLTGQQRELLRKRALEFEVGYQRRTNPAAAAAWEAAHDASGSPQQGDARVAKAEEIRKSEPGISEYEALVRAGREAAA